MKRLTTLLLVVVMVLSMLAACGAPSADTPNDTKPAAPAPTDAANPEEPVTLTWVIYAEEKPESQRIWKLFNEKLQEKLPNTTVEFVCLDSPSYNDKSQLIVSSGEYFDIMWASNWKGAYMEKVTGGAFLPLGDLIAEHTPALMDAIPEGDWGLLMVRNELYGVPCHQTVLNGRALDVLTEFYDQYANLIDEDFVVASATDPNVSAAEAMRVVEPLLAKAKEVYPDRIPMTDFVYSMHKNYAELVKGPDDVMLVGLKKFSDDTTVYNVLESDEFRDFCELAATWQDAGYLPNDIATYENLPPSQWAAEGPLVRFDNYELDHPQNDANKIKLTGGTYEDVLFVAPYHFGATGPSSANFISAKSKNPVRALQLLELLNTDAELYNLLCWGDEACYSFAEDGTFVADSEVYSMRDWVIGNTDNSFSMQTNADLVQANAEVMNNAPISPVMGFTFDISPIETEIAAVTAIVSSYSKTLVFGLNSDWESVYNEMCTQAKAAGIDRIVEEAQRQLDEWLALQN